MNLLSYLDHVTSIDPQKPAFIFFSARSKTWEALSFAQLADLTQYFTCGLLACRVIPGMRAAMMTPPSIEFFALALAMLKLGVVPVIVDPAIGLKKVGECLKETEPHIFIGNSITHGLRILFGWGKDSVKINLTIQSAKSKKLKNELPEPQSMSAEAPAAIIYTSGSTGAPKGVIYSQANFAAQLEMLRNTFDISQDEIDLPAFPLYALIDALLGVTSVIPDVTFPVPGNIDPARIVSAMQGYKVTNTFASPVVLNKLAEYGIPRNIKLSGLKRVITAGAPATIQLQEKFRKLLDDKTDLFGIYGATEALPIAKIESREIFKAKHKSAMGAGVCLGEPVEGVLVRIISITDSAIEGWDESLEVKANVVGEITIQGAAVTESYIAREDANLLSKIKHGDHIVHRSGDVGYFDDNNRLWYCGRKSDRVATNHGVFFTEQIEGIFNMHPFVYRTALVGVNREPVLWIELDRKADDKKITHELLELAKDHPQASKIKIFFYMKKFPTDVRHNSKIIREILGIMAKKRLS